MKASSYRERDPYNAVHESQMSVSFEIDDSMDGADNQRRQPRFDKNGEKFMR